MTCEQGWTRLVGGVKVRRSIKRAHSAIAFGQLCEHCGVGAWGLLRMTGLRAGDASFGAEAERSRWSLRQAGSPGPRGSVRRLLPKPQDDQPDHALARHDHPSSGRSGRVARPAILAL